MWQKIVTGCTNQSGESRIAVTAVEQVGRPWGPSDSERKFQSHNHVTKRKIGNNGMSHDHDLENT